MCAQRKDELEYWWTEHLRLNGVYWGVTALHLLGRPEALPKDETIQFVMSCQHENGGFGAAPHHDPHMLYTVSAIQILATVDAIEELEKSAPTGKAKVGRCTSLGANPPRWPVELIGAARYRRLARSPYRRLCGR